MLVCNSSDTKSFHVEENVSSHDRGRKIFACSEMRAELSEIM